MTNSIDMALFSNIESSYFPLFVFEQITYWIVIFESIRYTYFFFLEKYCNRVKCEWVVFDFMVHVGSIFLTQNISCWRFGSLCTYLCLRTFFEFDFVFQILFSNKWWEIIENSLHNSNRKTFVCRKRSMLLNFRKARGECTQKHCRL